MSHRERPLPFGAAHPEPGSAEEGDLPTNEHGTTQPLRKGELLGKGLAGAFFVVCVLALLGSLWVTIARGAATDEPRPKGLHFHKHVLSFNKAQNYVDEFRESAGERVLDSLLFSTYDLAAIASAKFGAYKAAERLTLLSAILWIGGMVLVWAF